MCTGEHDGGELTDNADNLLDLICLVLTPKQAQSDPLPDSQCQDPFNNQPRFASTPKCSLLRQSVLECAEWPQIADEWVALPFRQKRNPLVTCASLAEQSLWTITGNNVIGLLSTPIGLTIQNMALAPTDAQCDIRMSFDEWRRIADKAVFFLSPERIQFVVNEGVTIEQIYRSASGKTSAPLGRDAIRRVLEFQPSFLKKVKDIKKVVNSLVPDAFDDCDIISSVFSMPHLNDDIKVAQVDDAQIAKATGYTVEAVISAREHYRIPLDFGLKIIQFLNGKAPDQTVERCLTITGGGDRRYVKTIGPKDKPVYVFGSDHLVPAPADGYPWARRG